jgi:hypothetical protein
MPPHEQDDEDNDDSMEREVSGRLVLPGRIHCGLNHVEGWGLLPKWQSLPLSLACVRTSQNVFIVHSWTHYPRPPSLLALAVFLSGDQHCMESSRADPRFLSLLSGGRSCA